MRITRCYDNGAMIAAADSKCVDSMGLCRDQCVGPALEKSSLVAPAATLRSESNRLTRQTSAARDLQWPP